ncbi:hypothetical protein PVK06_026942 [Gossypium arboreum]|uniref:Uncharacterized protein n=1 Tax=Gossypium arboreum TaxID=29729 RepID=A0ABR0NZ34_GOSAR|nr:hypothetical protein PVK06_026942 [Gossypium arboreum]
MGNGSRDDIVERLETLPFSEQNLNENILSTSTQFQWVRQDVDEDIYELDADRERVGTRSREKQKFTHTAGSKSFACVVGAEERSFGKKVGCFQLFYITHRKKDGSPMTSEAREIMEKLKDKTAEYEAIASSDSSVNHEDIDNRIITEVLGPERYGRQYMPLGSQAQAEVQRLRDQIAQMQASTVEQIAQLRVEAATREAE